MDRRSFLTTTLLAAGVIAATSSAALALPAPAARDAIAPEGPSIMSGGGAGIGAAGAGVAGAAGEPSGGLVCRVKTCSRSLLRPRVF